MEGIRAAECAYALRLQERWAMTTSSGNWLFAEMKQAAKEYEAVPPWARPVVTVPYADSPKEPRLPVGFTAEKPADQR